MGLKIIPLVTLADDADPAPHRVMMAKRDGAILDHRDAVGVDGLAVGGSSKFIAMSHGLTTSMVTTEMMLGNGVGNVLYVVMMNVPINTVLTGVGFIQTVQGVFTAASFNGFGLYQYDGSGEYSKLAATADDGTIWKNVADTTVKVPFVTPVSVTAGAYWVLLNFVSSGTPTTSPRIAAAFDVSSAALSILDGDGTFKTYQGQDGSAGSSLPAAFATYTAAIWRPWLALY